MTLFFIDVQVLAELGFTQEGIDQLVEDKEDRANHDKWTNTL